MDQWTNIDDIAAIYTVGNLFRNGITIFVPKNDDLGAATCNSKISIPFVKWIEHGIWISGSLNKLCSKHIKSFLRNGSMCHCIECTKSDVNDDNNKINEFNCVEMNKIYTFLNQSLVAIQNISLFVANKVKILAPFTDNDINPIINLCIESMNTIINFINVLKYSTYNCKYFERYLSNATRYRNFVYRLLKILINILEMCTIKKVLNKNGWVKIDWRIITSKLLPKLQSIQQITFFQRDLLLIALDLQQHDQDSKRFGIRGELLSYIDNMLQIEHNKCCTLESKCDDNGSKFIDLKIINDKSVPFVSFLFDKLNQRAIKFIVQCAGYGNEICETTVNGAHCLYVIMSIITHLEQDSTCNKRNFAYIRQLFDENQTNILPVILKWTRHDCNYDHGIDSRTGALLCFHKMAGLQCLGCMIQYQINCLKQSPDNNNVIEYSYPCSNPTTRKLEFIDSSVRKMISVRLEMISKHLSKIKPGDDWFEFQTSLQYNLKLYELIDATNGTPNSIVAGAIKSMNRQWTDENFVKLYQEYLDPDLKLGDFLNQFPWLFLCSIRPAFCHNMRQKHWYKSLSMLELIDNCMYRNMETEPKWECIIDDIMAIAGKRKDGYLVEVEDPREAYMPEKLLCLMDFIHEHLDKRSDYNYYKDNTYLINKIVLTLKRMTVCWLPKLIVLPTMHIKNGSNAAWTIQDSVLCAAEHTIIQSLNGGLGMSNDCDNCNQYPIWHKIVKKGCYFVLKNKCANDRDYYLSQLWRINGILNFYHLLQFDLNSNDIHLKNKINLKSTMYCFRQVLKYSGNSFDTMECFQFLLLLHLLNENNYAIEKYQMKISNNHQLSYLKDWIEQMVDIDQTSNDKVYHFMDQIINHNHYDNRNDKFKYAENDFVNDLQTNASSIAAMVINNESFSHTICNTMTFKQCNWIKCNKKNIKLRKCKKCKSVFYCSKQCQKDDWKAHRQICCLEKF